MIKKHMSKKKATKVYVNDTKKELEILIGDFRFQAKNENQNKFCKLIEEKEIVICSGPAGVGKSMLSVAKALELLKKKDNEFYKIVVCTPAVEADERLGFLPGDIAQKMEPYIYSIKYLMEKLVGKEVVKTLMENGFIEIMPLAFMRGINIDNTIVIAEEFQNATPRQVKTLLTRIGYNSKFIISGDLEQSDKFKDAKKSGLADVLTRLVDVEEIGIFKFDQVDIVRNKVISKILDKYKD